MGAYSRLVLIQGWALVKFSPFSASVVCLFCSKNETKKGFFKMLNTLKKTPSSRKSLSTYSFLEEGVNGVNRLATKGNNITDYRQNAKKITDYREENY